MKSIKLDHNLAELVRLGQKTSTWRLFDDKDLSVNDVVRLIDKVDPQRPETWQTMGEARIREVIEKPLGDITEADMDGHEKFASFDEMLTTYQKYYGNDVSKTTVVKIVHIIYDNTQQITDAVITTNPTQKIQKVKIYADGGSRGNPGPSASGFVIIDAASDKVIVDKGVYLGITTNNQAEYMAVKLALEEAHKMSANDIDVYLDSMLVVNQMKGVFKVRNRDLWPLHDAVKQLVSTFAHITFTHVPREFNRLADAAVNRALDEQLDDNAGREVTPLAP